jgi:predicted ATPase/transcriptional regulator with XRE-family HTH domain
MARVAVNDPSASFGELLRDHRRAVGLTQAELAERAGVSPRSISGLEREDAHIPRRDTVDLLVQALGLEGPARQAFEAIVDRRRGPRLNPNPGATPAQRPVKRESSIAERAVEPLKHNLPRSLTSFVGREHELTELTHVLPTAPLLTLVGAGGVGKTRLAQELVGNHLERYVDGSWLVELAGLADPSLLPGAVAAAVGLRDVHARSITTILTDYLSTKHVLLVLDNCEHLVEACAELVAHLLRTCPHLHVLATSREPLAIAGEITWRVPPLGLPDLQQPLSAEQITATPAVRLFIERARAVDNTLVLTESNAAAIARICIDVDGIPLALELAAARVRVLTLEQLAERLAYDSGVLGGVDRAGLPQHQTIRATIDWSHDLLCEQERVLLRRLSVFAGSWTLDMAEKVCSDAGIEAADILDLLTQLVDRSMVVVDAQGAVARYRLLQPIRQYALEQLESSGEADTYRRRHAAALVELAGTGDTDPCGPDEIPSLDRLEAEHDNLRAALRWALTHRDNEAALRASAALFPLWERRGHFQEGREWLDQALAGAGDAPAWYRGRALNALATLCWEGGDSPRAQPIAEQALTLGSQAGDTRSVAWALVNLGMIAFYRDDPELAVARLEESVPFAREAGDLSFLSLALTLLGRTLVWAKGPHSPQAAVALEESLALAKAAQSLHATGQALTMLGDLVWHQGDAERAIGLWRQSLEVRCRLEDRRGIAGCLEHLALALAASGRFESAAWLFGAAEAQRTRMGLVQRHDDQADHTRLVQVAREGLGDAFATVWAHGQAATMDDAVTRALDCTRWLSSASRAGSTGSAGGARQRSPDDVPMLSLAARGHS